MADEFRPCPFCGSGLVGQDLSFSSRPSDVPHGPVGCVLCGCEGPKAYPETELVSRWNTRSADTAEKCVEKYREARRLVIDLVVQITMEVHDFESSDKFRLLMERATDFINEST